MSPIKLSIHGDYIDCQIYRGRLYLWTMDGKLCVYDWVKLILSLIQDETEKLIFAFSFLDGNFLYKKSIIELFKDKDFNAVLFSKFKRLEGRCLLLEEKDIRPFLIGEMDTPTKRFPIDTEIYSNKLYFITENGMFVSSAHKNRGSVNPVSSRPKKIWDARALSIKANRYPQIAISAGFDGLFEYDLSSFNEPMKISDKHSTFANYTNSSIYSSSLCGKSYFSYFGWNQEKQKQNLFVREWLKNFDDSLFFENDNLLLSWGFGNKIYKVSKNGFESVRLTKNAAYDYEKNPIYKIKDFKYKNIIGGTSTYFGNIVEYKDSLLVALTNGQILEIKDPIVRWRVYPRSLNYENHLHVILEDRIDVYSFYHDYFIEQKNKNLGVDYLDDSWTSRRNILSSISYWEMNDLI